MPRRTNDFQALVRLIERQLHGRGAIVTESVLLQDSGSGELREVDVVIEARLGPRTIVIAVECRDRARPASIEWIDQLAGKYERLPVDRIVAVSRSGFTKKALAKAENKHIETLSFKGAAQLEWPRLIDRLARLHIDAHLPLKARKVTLLFSPPLPEPDLPRGADVAKSVLVDDEGNGLGTVAEYVERQLAQPELVDDIYAQVPGDGTWAILTRIDLGAATTVRTPAGERHAVAAIDLEVQFVRERIALPLEAALYGRARVRHGAVSALGSRIVAAAVDHRADDATLSVEVRREA